MKKINFNHNWTRAIGEGKANWMQDTNPRVEVTLPDDYIINMERSPDAIGGAATGFFPGGRAVYRKNFDVPTEWAGQSVILDIDGAYMNAEVTLNGEALGIHPYGYTPWQLDITDTIIPGEDNELEIITRCTQPNSRWYSGGGLYREVNLWLGEECHIKPWDIFITTPKVTKEKATIKIEATLTNSSENQVKGELTVAICEKTSTIDVMVDKNSHKQISLEIELDDPLLWSAETPNLHDLTVTLTTNLGTDVSNQKIGIRQIDIDAKNGMRVNGDPVKLLGGCIHHDNTLLGASAYPKAEERKIRRLKEAGYNAIRTAHNPPSNALLEACDRLGMYVINESFDCWRIGKSDLDYHLYFDDWWQRDTTAMVMRDRNHPSVFCWSIGNELKESGGMSDGANLTKMQADFVRTLDPSRPVTIGIHSMIKSKRSKGKPAIIPFNPMQQGQKSKEETAERMKKMMSDPHAFDEAISQIETNNMGNGMIDGHDIWGELSAPTLEAIDIVGYNYLYKRYATDREKYPDRIIIGSETHATTTYDYYQAMMQNPNVIGDFIWTAYDNLGEAGAGRVIRNVQDMMTGMLGAYPWLSCYQGDLDLSGNRRPQSYYRKIMWGQDAGIHLFAKPPQFIGRKSSGLGWQWSDVYKSWTWPDEYLGHPIDLEAYADCDEVEYILNGKTLGVTTVNRLVSNFTIPYHPGTLKAIAYKNGQPVAEAILETAGIPAKINLITETATIQADEIDLAFVQIEILDEKGIIVPTENIELTASVIGGKLAGFGSGNPCTDENYGTGKRRTWNGLALICLTADIDSRDITLTVGAEGLPIAEITLPCK